MEQEFKDLLESFLEETGAQLSADAQEVVAYMDERAAHLSTLVGQPGFQMAVAAERDSVAIKASIEVMDNADAVDQRFVGLIQGALAIGAKALAA